jgi:hypothetical protein
VTLVNLRTPLTTVAVLAAIAVAAPSTTGAASLYKPCSGSFDPQGNPGGGFYRAITAKRVTCSTARSVTKAWVVAHKSGSTNPTSKSVVKGYTCTGSVPAANALKILCRRDGGRKAVRFVGSP